MRFEVGVTGSRRVGGVGEEGREVSEYSGDGARRWWAGGKEGGRKGGRWWVAHAATSGGVMRWGGGRWTAVATAVEAHEHHFY